MKLSCRENHEAVNPVQILEKVEETHPAVEIFEYNSDLRNHHAFQEFSFLDNVS